MKSITIHNLDSRLAALIERRAKEEGLSMNKLIKRLLAQALGLSPQPRQNKKEQFEDLLGSWSQEDFEEFEKNTKDLRTIDPQDWI
ncbi:MAG: ribbon-helix-helix protein, CopG family [Lewinellaceae bacterium]|nr:ribbon-helix-helix protein, CopG family [Lewinellaceae bacterium]MCB9289918.1 ribbon-helix-helix protein, CopG family [Lewinellaceae bacterium]